MYIGDVEEETFKAFCEFGYKENCNTHSCKDNEDDGHSDAEGISFQYAGRIFAHILDQLEDQNSQKEPEPEPEPEQR